MPADSVKQQQAAGMALAAKRGDRPMSSLHGAAKSMAKMGSQDLRHFAQTSHKGLPQHVKK